MTPHSLSLQRPRPVPGGDFRLHLRRSVAGVALIEVVVASALMLMVAVGVTHVLMTSTRIASANRVLTAARTVVQRNLDNAMAVRWDTTYTPPILAITSAAGSVYDDDGNLNGEGTNKVALLVEKKDTGGTTYTVIEGTLNRIVQTVMNTQGADIRSVRFRLSYRFHKRDMVVEMGSMRAIDD